MTFTWPPSTTGIYYTINRWRNRIRQLGIWYYNDGRMNYSKFPNGFCFTVRYEKLLIKKRKHPKLLNANKRDENNLTCLMRHGLRALYIA